MKISVTIPDEKFEALESVAGSGKVPKLLADSVDFLLTYKPKDNNILLNGKQVAAISTAVGGKTLRSGDDLVKLFENNFKIGLNGEGTVTVDPEDLHALRAQWQGMGFDKTTSFDNYVAYVLKDALSLFLYGSTTGQMAWH